MSDEEGSKRDIRARLDNPDLKLAFDSPDDAYRLEYYSVASIDPVTKKREASRRYRLLHRPTRSVIIDPWDQYDAEKQSVLLARLMAYSGYRLAEVVTGWRAVCPKCGEKYSGRHWDPAPTTCKQAKCGSPLEAEDVRET